MWERIRVLGIVRVERTAVAKATSNRRMSIARLHRKTLCYLKSIEMLEHSIKLLVHYLKFSDVPVPYRQQYRYSKRSLFD